MFLFREDSVDVVVDVFEQVQHSLNAVEHVKHPKGVEQKEQDHNGHIDRLGHDSALESGGFGNLVIHVDHVEHVDEPEQKDDEQDDLKEHEVEMAHQPLRCQIIPMPDFSHKIIEGHNIS